ncbi:MAG TPA: tRNA dihydrouridine synthase DusB, partial [Anaerolineales bacterium]|nr:tRNA dihydrouridine synthase DusB [Anaerolineales bacterium]
MTPHFFVRDVPVYDDVILSPMDGFSDLPFRLICRELGSAMSYTEFVSVDELVHNVKRAQRKLKFDPSERPMVFQIYGHEEDRLVEVASRVERLGPDIIDLNMGCWVNSVSGRGAGAGLLRTPEKIGRIFARLTRTLRVPVTGKIRLGWDDAARNYLEVARILEDSGASLIAVHGRTKAQAYKGNADWDAIGEVKAAVKIPVVGSGDVKCAADIERMKRHTGVDAVMIGRTAIGNPWIFARKDRDQVTREEIVALMRRHLALNIDFYGEEGGILLFRKHAARYIPDTAASRALRLAMLTTTSRAELEDLISRFEAGEIFTTESTHLPLRQSAAAVQGQNTERS